MTTRKPPAKSVKAVPSSITQILESSPVLPGESEEVYQQGLIATVHELGATTPLQIYLAEKIYECLWWMRRYENQKRATLIRKMAQILASSGAGSEVTELESAVTEHLQANVIDNGLNELIAKHKLNMVSLTQKAMAHSRLEHVSLDKMIAVKAKTLAGFQASYEVLVNRKVNAERMRLQNALMSRDLGAIEMEDADVVTSKPQKRQANRRNSLKSTGPRSRRGKQSSSLNALRHGLSGGADLRLNDPDVSSIASLIELDGFEPQQATELAIKILDYEKNLAYQRQLLDGSVVQSLPEPDIQALLKLSFGREIEMLDDIAEEDFELKGRYNLRDLKFVHRMKLKMT